MTEQQLIWWCKWLSTFGAVGCSIASSLDWYPINVWLGWAAGVGWTWVAWRWKEWKQLVINKGQQGSSDLDHLCKMRCRKGCYQEQKYNV